MKGSENRSVVSDSFRPPWLYSPWNSPGQDTGVGSLSLVQGVFQSPSLPHCRWILYQWSKKLGFYSSQWFQVKKLMHHCQNKWKDILNSWIDFHYWNGNILQIDLQIQGNPYNFSWLLCRNWHVDLKIYTEIKGTQNSQNNLEIQEPV